MKRLFKVILVAVIFMGLVGCSSGSSDDGADEKNGDSTTTVPGGSGSDTPTPPPSTGAIDRSDPAEGTGIIKTTRMDSCDTEPGEVKASGTVKLAEGMDPATVSISVSWVNAETATVFARSRVQVENVTADETEDWKVDNTLPDNDAPVRCVLGAVALEG